MPELELNFLIDAIISSLMVGLGISEFEAEAISQLDLRQRQFPSWAGESFFSSFPLPISFGKKNSEIRFGSAGLLMPNPADARRTVSSVPRARTGGLRLKPIRFFLPRSWLLLPKGQRRAEPENFPLSRAEKG